MLEVKYLQKKIWQKQTLKNARINKTYKTY